MRMQTHFARADAQLTLTATVWTDSRPLRRRGPVTFRPTGAGITDSLLHAHQLPSTMLVRTTKIALFRENNWEAVWTADALSEQAAGAASMRSPCAMRLPRTSRKDEELCYHRFPN